MLCGGVSVCDTGPDEDLPRDMAHFEFICHAPSDYFKQHGQYQQSLHAANGRLLGCVWTSLSAAPSIEPLSQCSSSDARPGGVMDHYSEQQSAGRIDNNAPRSFVNEQHSESQRSSSFRDKTRSSHKAATGFTRSSKDRLMIR